MADAYTNDLRLREQEVGANSGAWGGYLNTTLENIAESWSYGTEALADSATQTLTLADGTSDELRSFYVKLTGTLSQATTVTIAPNTISKSWMIENATTGGYAVTISQGSGANVAIANGNVKMIATDGAGAGAVVYDLFTDLELAGGLTVSGDVTSGGSFLVTGDVAAGDDAAIGYNSTQGLILTGQGSSQDVTIKNDANAKVFSINTGTTEAIFEGKVGIGNATPGNSHANANLLVVGSGSAGGIGLWNGANSGGYYFSRDNSNTTDAYDGGMSYDASRNLKFHTNAGATRMTIDGSGHVTMPAQSNAGVNMTLQSNVATTPTTLDFDTERFDQNADFNTSTNTFTAPVTGKYLVCVNLYMLNVDQAADYYQLYVATSNKTYYSIFDPGGNSGDLVYWDMSWAGVVDMDASDTCLFKINQSGGTAQTDYSDSSYASITLLT